MSAKLTDISYDGDDNSTSVNAATNIHADSIARPLPDRTASDQNPRYETGYGEEPDPDIMPSSFGDEHNGNVSHTNGQGSEAQEMTPDPIPAVHEPLQMKEDG